MSVRPVQVLLEGLVVPRTNVLRGDIPPCVLHGREVIRRVYLAGFMRHVGNGNWRIPRSIKDDARIDGASER